MLIINYNTYFYKQSNIFSNRVYKLLYFFSEIELKIPTAFIEYKSYERVKYQSDFRNFIQSLVKEGKLDFYRRNLIKLIHVLNFQSKVPGNAWNYDTFNNLSSLVFFALFSTSGMYFKFSFHRIDKKIRKFSRGKSGKYRIVFNYVPPFKRKKWVFKIFLKNLKLMPDPSYYKKLLSLLLLILNKPSKTLVYQFRNFSNNYVYNNKFNSILINSN